MSATEKQSPVPDGVHLWLLLWKAARSIEQHAHESIRATGLCLSDFGILEALLHKGPLPVNAFREKLLLTSGSMTAAVDRLQHAGLVERRAIASDRRARIVHLTEKGRKQIQGLFREHARDMENAFSGLNASERRSLAALLRKAGHGTTR